MKADGAHAGMTVSDAAIGVFAVVDNGFDGQTQATEQSGRLLASKNVKHHLNKPTGDSR